MTQPGPGRRCRSGPGFIIAEAQDLRTKLEEAGWAWQNHFREREWPRQGLVLTSGDARKIWEGSRRILCESLVMGVRGDGEELPEERGSRTLDYSLTRRALWPLSYGGRWAQLCPDETKWPSRGSETGSDTRRSHEQLSLTPRHDRLLSNHENGTQ